MSATANESAESCTLEYELIGPAAAPVILVLGGISATRHVARSATEPAPGWWDDVVGGGRGIDTRSHRVLGIDYADGGRGPDGRPAHVITTHDQAAAIVALLDALEIDSLHLAVGASYGGMVALALAERFPSRVRALVVVSAAHEPHAMCVGLRAIQRQVVELGLETGRASDGMALARAIAMTTYRSAREFEERFGAQIAASEPPEFAVERYLTAAGRRFAARMSPERFLALSLSVDLHRATPEDIRVPTTVIAAEGDTLAPPDQLRAMASRLPYLTAFHTLETRCGHDAFLTEQRQLGALLANSFRN